MTVSTEAFEKLLDKAVNLEVELRAERERADALAACLKDLEKFAEDSGCDMCNPAMINAYKIRSDYEPHLAQLKARVAAEALEAEIENGDYSAFAKASLRDGVEYYRKRADEIAAGGGHE